MSEHSILSPSSAAAYMACPGSLATQRFYEDKTNEAAEEGTRAHALAEHCLLNGVKSLAAEVGKYFMLCDDGSFIMDDKSDCEDVYFVPEDEAKYLFEITEEMAEGVTFYLEKVDEVRQQFLNTPGVKSVDLHVEYKVDFSPVVGIEDQKGTADVVMVVTKPKNHQEVVIMDLKYGFGAVTAVENPQLSVYASGAAYELTAGGMIVDNAHLFIVQPRVSAAEKRFTEYSMTAKELADFTGEYIERANEAYENYEVAANFDSFDDAASELTLVAGTKQCKYCPANTTCPAATAHVEVATAIDFTDLSTVADMEPVNKMSSATLAQKYDALEYVKNWVKAVEDEAYRRAELGELEGKKLIAGRQGNRFWTDTKQAEKMMRDTMRLKKDDMYTQEIISPTAAEKLLKGSTRRWNKLQPLIGRKDTKGKIVDNNHPGKAINVQVTDLDDFGDLA